MKESVLENKTREELEKKQRINSLLSVMFIDVVIFVLYISQKILS